MSARPDHYDAVHVRAAAHSRAWLSDVPRRTVPPKSSCDDIVAALGGDLPDGPTDPAAVIDLLAERIEPGLMAMPSGRFFGWVIGGTLPAALGADWLVSAWDQNTGMRYATPGVTGTEESAAAWLLDLLGLPTTSDVGFVTGATMANFTGLAAGRQSVLTRAGWDLDRDGLTGAPRVTVIVGEERHGTVDLALRYQGLGAPTAVPADDEGRIRPDALADALAAADGPTIVALQAGNLHSGAFDPFEDCIDLAHQHGAWVHIDGAFGLFAAASRDHRHLTTGYEKADSWTTDAHKTLNVPYDCGIVIVRDRAALRAAMGMHGDYLIQSEQGEPMDTVPEVSRRGRAFTVWAVLHALGRSGVADLVDGFCRHASALADGVREMGGEVLNDVEFTQVCASFGSDERTRAVVEGMLADGTAWMTGSLWHGRAVLRVSVSNWSTTEDDVRRSLDALRMVVGKLAS